MALLLSPSFPWHSVFFIQKRSNVICSFQTHCPSYRYLVLQQPLGADHVLKYVSSHVGVHCREGVVEEVDVGVTVHGPGQAHTLLLAPRQVHALGRHAAEGGFPGEPQHMWKGRPAQDADPGWRPWGAAPAPSSLRRGKT